MKQRFRRFVAQCEIRAHSRSGADYADWRAAGSFRTGIQSGRHVQAAMQNPAIPAAMLQEPLGEQWLPKFGEAEMQQTWFEQYQERRAVIRQNQQNNLTAEQSERYAREVRGGMQDLVQARRRERQKEAENGGFFEVAEDHAMVDQHIKWPPGSDRHPFQRVADLSLKIAGRNKNLRDRLCRLLSEEAVKGTCAAAIYEAVWETINNLADDVLDEAIGVVYDEPKAKAATAA